MPLNRVVEAPGGISAKSLLEAKEKRKHRKKKKRLAWEKPTSERGETNWISQGKKRKGTNGAQYPGDPVSP